MINLFHICPFGPGFNIGNFLIQQAVRRFFLNESDTHINFITLPATGLGLDSGLSKKTVHRINQVADGVIVGGGNLFENNELDVDLQALSSLRKPLMLFSCSYGRIRDEQGLLVPRTDCMPDTVLAALASKACVNLSRDMATYEKVESLDSSHAFHAVGGCPSIFIDSLWAEETNRWCSDAISLVAIRNPEIMNVPFERKLEIPKITNDILELLKDHCAQEVIVLCNDQRDIEYGRSLKAPVFYTSDVYEYFKLLRSVKTAVSFRVHSSLPLWSMGTAAVNLSYDERSSSLIETLGMQHLDLNLFDFGVGSRGGLMKQIAQKLDSTDQIKNISVWESLLDIQKKGVGNFIKIVEDVKCS